MRRLLAILTTAGFAVSLTACHSPSGEDMPVGDLAGWRQVMTEDFTLDAPQGSWGTECDHTHIDYVGATGTQWRSYPRCFLDTYQGRPYRSDAVLSVHDGVLDFNLHQVDGQPAGANPSPILSTGTQYQTYGRYVARMRVTTPPSWGYAAWLLWPETEEWSDGEIDFPEGYLDGEVFGFTHCVGTPTVNCGAADTDGATFTDWHTYVTEWSPGRVRFLLDGDVVMDYVGEVPTVPMRWQLQTETNGPAADEAGHVEVDWVTAYEWSG